jgi:hypothetical protein
MHLNTAVLKVSLALIVLLVPGQAAMAVDPPRQAAITHQEHIKEALHDTPTMFVENVGQFADTARFQFHAAGRTLWLAEDGLWMTAFEPKDNTAQELDQDLQPPLHTSASPAAKGVNVKISFPGANLHPRLEPFHRLDTRVSYFAGNDPARWHSDVPVWGGVRYVDLYPGIDLEISGLQSQGMWRLVTRDSQFAASDVRLQVEGAEGVSLDGDRLCLHTAIGDFILPLLAVEGTVPAAPPAISGPEPGTFQVAFPFSLAPPLPSARTQDDPDDLLYASFLGGSGYARGDGIAIDGDGAAYVTGYTESTGFPTTPGVFDTTLNGSADAFVVKENPSGTGLAYASFLGGSSEDWGDGIAVDGDGAAYVTGWTSSSDFSTTSGALDTTYNGYTDAFVVKVNPSGTEMVYASFLRGSSYDEGYGIAVDGDGAAYVTGLTRSYDFHTTPGAFDTTYNGYGDAFVVKVNPSGTGLAYASFLGGSDSDSGSGIAVDEAGAAYVTGWTRSSDFPTTSGAFDTTFNGNSDAFVAKVNPAATGLAYASFLGGSDSERGHGIAVNEAGAVYVTGDTYSSDFPTTPGAFDTIYNGGSGDVFLVKVNPSATGLAYASFLGGSGLDWGKGIAVDGAGAAYVTGETASANFPTTPGAFDTTHNSYGDAFVVKVNPSATGLAYATFLGGNFSDLGNGIAVDGDGAAYVTGLTSSSDFPTPPGSFDTTYNGSFDAVVAKLAMGGESGPRYSIFLPAVCRTDT